MIVILGGTTEARRLFLSLQERKMPAVISVATDYGYNLLNVPRTHANVGRLDVQGLTGFIRDKGGVVIVDATHPFAVEASRNGMKAASEMGIEYIRLEREREELPQSGLVKRIKEPDELKLYLREGITVFSALGSKYLGRILSMVDEMNGRLVARVLPLPSVIERCRELKLKPANIVAIQGPFSRWLNRELFRGFETDLVLVKESGREGGEKANVEAALELGIEVVIWQRPKLDYPVVFNNGEKLIQYLIENRGELK